jgi:hypothetical protein
MNDQLSTITFLSLSPVVFDEPFSSHGGANEAPPSYNDLFPTISNVRETVNNAREGGTTERAKLPLKLCDILCKSLFCGCCYLILAAVPIVMIVIGSVYLHDCNIESRIPIFLIVFGCVSLLQTCFGLIKMAICRKDENDNDNRKKKSGNFCESLITTFLIIWIIIGSVYVFGAWPTWQLHGSNGCTFPNGTVSNGPYCCNPVLMIFSYVSLIIMYGMTAIFCFCIICCAVLLGMAAQSN